LGGSSIADNSSWRSIMEMNPPDDQPIRIAIVEGYQLVLDGLAATLSADDNQLVVVAAESRWTRLLAHREFPMDVVVIDLHLDDGIPIATKIRVLNAAGSAAVVISGRSDGASIREAIQSGALSFVPKTDGVAELVLAIRAAARNEQHLSVSMAAVISGMTQSEDAKLGEREQHALALYASGRTIKEVAVGMGTTEETVKSYIKRGRRKYRKVGVDVSSKILLRSHGIRQGWISPE
jgi:two-component system uhpT operon response regulator UhpA